MKDDAISSGQLLVCVYLAMTAEMLIRPYREAIEFPAQILIPAAGLNLMFAALLMHLRPPNGISCKERAQSLTGRLVLLLAAAVMSVSGGAALNDADGFLSFTGDHQLSFFLFLPLVLLLVLYAVRLGVEGFARVGGAVLILLLFSLALVLFSNLKDLRLQNLQIQPNPQRRLTRAISTGIYFSPALLAGSVLSEKTAAGRRLRWGRLLLGVFATYFSFTVIGELVLGSFASVQRQSFYTLARIGGVSVFRRLDSLHSSIWMMALLLGVIMEASAVELVLRGLLPGKWKKYTALLTVLLFGGSAVLIHLYLCPQLWQGMTIGAAACTLLLSVGQKRRHAKR